MRNSIINSMAVADASNDRAPVRGLLGSPGGQTSPAGAFLQSTNLGGDGDDARPSRSGSVPTRKDGSDVGIVADIGIRAIGLAAIALSAAIIGWLHAYMQQNPASEASLWQLALLAVAFLSASVGCGLAALGRHIHDRIEVAERWRRRF